MYQAPKRALFNCLVTALLKYNLNTIKPPILSTQVKGFLLHLLSLQPSTFRILSSSPEEMNPISITFPFPLCPPRLCQPPIYFLPVWSCLCWKGIYFNLMEPFVMVLFILEVFEIHLYRKMHHNFNPIGCWISDYMIYHILLIYSLTVEFLILFSAFDSI